MYKCVCVCVCICPVVSCTTMPLPRSRAQFGQQESSSSQPSQPTKRTAMATFGFGRSQVGVLPRINPVRYQTQGYCSLLFYDIFCFWLFFCAADGSPYRQRPRHNRKRPGAAMGSQMFWKRFILSLAVD